MSGIYIPGSRVPQKCVGCEWRDAEMGGDCEFMPNNDYDTYSIQFEHCPFKRFSELFVPVPEHGDLIDRDEIKYDWDEDNQTWGYDIHSAPTIIPADPVKEGEG